MLSTITKILSTVDDFVWGLPLIILILATGLFLTVRLRGLQIKRLPLAIKYMFSSDEEDGSGEVSSFAALCTALSATIGTGNIVGVATAIVSGGPFYYIENGMGKQFGWLAKIFAIFGIMVGLFGIGTFTQINGITSAIGNFFDKESVHYVNLFGRDYSLTIIISGIILTFFVASVLIGGLKRISNVVQIIVPFMAIIYVAVVMIILILNPGKIPAALIEIVQGAFGLRAFGGGMFGAMIVAMQKGIARGIFSNEAGLGSAPIAAAAAQSKEEVRQGLISMLGTSLLLSVQ
jgi:Na+/alanine symporter